MCSGNPAPKTVVAEITKEEGGILECCSSSCYGTATKFQMHDILTLQDLTMISSMLLWRCVRNPSVKVKGLFSVSRAFVCCSIGAAAT